eukprot:CAMPEP_0206529300 /NCGR_PEP_ID=MMETSP0325_2-20121206/2517_1 /ASSEMBLY_ACC=CAM_ASM_000347 /TAXON_ID=2866 /ORGANISM="Crypthecodinium cohnii, Strain Seligo" /LENGTH=38 /DNA_ID= /DNA_START= /DNA_END= /DNA_ORIENTATION=
MDRSDFKEAGDSAQKLEGLWTNKKVIFELTYHDYLQAP